MKKVLKFLRIVCAMSIIAVMVLPLTISNNLSNIQKSKELFAGKTISWDGYDFTLNEPVYQMAEGTFPCDGADIVRTATQLLGKPYSFGDKGEIGSAYHGGNAAAAGNVTGVDCSGLIWWTLKTLQQGGVDFGSLSLGQGSASTVPIDSRDWLIYGSAKRWVNDGGYFSRNYNASTGTYTQYQFKARDESAPYSSIDAYSGKKVNILKRNDPITSSYRWYNYVTSDGKIAELPAGTLVISASELINDGVKRIDHCWIALGNLGTTNKDEAIAAIQEKFGIDVSSLSNYVLGDESTEGSTTCTYWKIEAAGNNVTINNGDPDYLATIQTHGRVKGTGPIWAFQLGNDDVVTGGSFSMDIKKVDRETGEALPGAKFHFEDRNTNPYTIQDDLETGSDGKVTLVSNQAITGENQGFRYAVYEKEPPEGYGSDIFRFFGVNFNTRKVNDEYRVTSVTIHGGNIEQKVIGVGQTFQYKTDGTWAEGGTITDDTYFVVSLGNSDTHVHLALTLANPKTEGSFNIKLRKRKSVDEDEDGENDPLPGARFAVSVQRNEDGRTSTIYSGSALTNGNGNATFSGINIKGADERYTVTLSETTVPDGYVGMPGSITFPVTTKLNEESNTYELVADGEINVENAKKVEVKAGEILIEAENRSTSIDIHKGVKTVENQDSGYYAVQKAIEEAVEKQASEDAEVDPTYEDENTGIEYTEEELKDIAHEWVVETTIPEGIEKYKRYIVTDPVDTTKLEFAGLDRVHVYLLDAQGNVKKELEESKDYVAEYEDDVLEITYIDSSFRFRGDFISAANIEADESLIGSKVRIVFNTTFKINPETGKLAVLDGVVTNADNKAVLRYDTGNGKIHEKESENPEVHTGAVSIFKYEDTNGNGKHDEGEKALVGAKFKIALSKEDALNGNFVKIGGKELEAESNEHGIATFVGLSFGGDATDDERNLIEGLYAYDWETASRDYYIVETYTPEGYEKMTDVLKTTVSKNSSEIIDITDKINEMDSIGNKPLKFDLALRKWVTHAYVTENGQTVEYKTGHKAEDDPEAVVKVDLKKSKLNQVTVKFKYSIRITNEGQIAGEAREITDYIPQGLKFVQEDNPDWTTTSNERVVKTRKLEGVTLQPGESAEVEIMLTWVNSKDNMGVMTNTAEISEDYNEYGVHDIDSTPNNQKWGEDDIDDAPVMLAIKTGSEVIAYTSIGLGFISIVTLGAIVIRKKFANI